MLPRYAVINAVAMFDPRGDDHFFALGNVNDELCFFDSRPTQTGRPNQYCLRDGSLPAEPKKLAETEASAGAALGTSYYYSCCTIVPL